MKKTLMKALEVHVTFANSFSQTCQHLFETCIRIGYLIHSGVFMCFYKSVYGYPGIRRFLILGIRFPKKNRKRTSLVFLALIGAYLIT